MKITPLELRQFEFEKTFRGYSIEEVDMFINNLAQEWERVLNETKMMRMQLELAEKEATKLREIEMTLFKTLKTAEDTSTMITEQANQQAEKSLAEASLKAKKQLSDAEMHVEKLIAEANMEAEKIVSDARLRANEMLNEAHKKSVYVKDELLSEVKTIEKDFESLKLYKTHLLEQMRNLAGATIEHVERFEGKFNADAIESKINRANEIINENIAEEIPPIVIPSPVVVPHPVVDEPADVVPDVQHTATIIEEKLPENPIAAVVEETSMPEAKPVDHRQLANWDDATDEFIAEEDNTDTEEEILDVVPDGEELIMATEWKGKDLEPATETYIEPQETPKPLSTVASKIATIASSANNLKFEDDKESPKPEPPQKMDDLTRIEGIGPKIQEVLNDHNIFTFRDLATTPLYKIKDFLAAAGSHYNMVDASTWTEQALLAAESRWDELKVRQDELMGGREVNDPTEELQAKVNEAIEVQKPLVKPETNGSNLENITEEMLEKVNKVKDAIRKAMAEKTDKPEADSKDPKLPTLDDVMKRNQAKGGSFFDNID